MKLAEKILLKKILVFIALHLFISGVIIYLIDLIYDISDFSFAIWWILIFIILVFCRWIDFIGSKITCKKF